MVAGFDDGVICLVDLQLSKGNSLRRPVFKMNNDKVSSSFEGPYDHFHESAYEHADSIISVETNAAENTEAVPLRIVSASKDGSLIVWRINSETQDEDKLTFVADFVIDEPLAKAKWLNEKSILTTTTHGNVYILKLERDGQNAECLSRPSFVFRADHSVSIWDCAVLSKSPRLEVWLAEDSGKVTQLTFDASLQMTGSKTVYVSVSFIELTLLFAAGFCQRVSSVS